MKTIRKRNLLCCAFLTIAMLFALLFIAPFSLTGKTASASVAYESAFVGDLIEAKDYTISSGGASVAAEGMTVVYPSGGVYGGDKFTMNQAGIYEVTYYASVGNERVEETCYYMAKRAPKDVIIGEDGMSIEYGKYYVESPYELKKATYGALVSFKAGQSVTFSAKIKTEKLTANYKFLDLIVMPSVFKETDFEKITVRVSDSEDESNYVDIVVISSNTLDGDGQVSYVQAGAASQLIGGYEGSKFHSASLNYGTQVEHSFRALARQGENRKNHTVSENSLTFAIDNAEKKVYCGPYSNTSTAMNMVNDLDDAAHYKGNPWGGFTSDEVTVKVMVDRFAKAEGKILFKTFGDVNFSQDNIQDKVSPDVIVDCDEAQGTPIAKVGENFPIFPFVAKDNLDAQVKSNVFVYYVDANNQKITVENDGAKFFAKYAGNYQIVYLAEDYSGNVSRKVLNVVAQEELPEIVFAIDEPIVDASIYQTVTIPLASQMQASGGSGYLKVERTVLDPNGNEVEATDSLYLTMLGEYKVNYTVTDYLGYETTGFITVKSNPIEAPIFISEPTFDSAFVKGFTYELPSALVIETVSDQVIELSYNIYVNGEVMEGSFVADGETMNIRYVAAGETGEAVWEKDFSVIDTEKGKYKSKYFYTESDLQIVDEKTYLDFRFSQESDAEFINSLCAQEFKLAFEYNAQEVNFSTMLITLTNVDNLAQSVTARFTYEKETDKWFIRLKGKEKVPYATSKGILIFLLSSSGNRIIDGDGAECATIETYENGAPFQGLGNELYLRISFQDVAGESAFRVTEVCNQSMGHNKKGGIEKAKDEIKPVIVLDAPFVTRQKIGAKAYIPTAKAYDVLGQIKEFTVTLEEVGVGVVASGDATLSLDYTFEKAGNYLVTYYAKDTNGNATSLPQPIQVSDETAPTLTVKDSLKDEYKLNAKIDIPSYTAVDNGENCYVQVTLILPNNEMRLLSYDVNGEVDYFLKNELYEKAFRVDEDTFVALYEGKYVLRVVAYDEYYNYTAYEAEFIVK